MGPLAEKTEVRGALDAPPKPGLQRPPGINGPVMLTVPGAAWLYGSSAPLDRPGGEQFSIHWDSPCVHVDGSWHKWQMHGLHSHENAEAEVEDASVSPGQRCMRNGCLTPTHV